MANVCDTRLKIRRDAPFSMEEMESIKKHLDDGDTYPLTACAYDGIYDIDNTDEHEGSIDVYLGTRWNVPTESLQELAKVFKCSITAKGEEEGNGFIQVVKIGEKGELLSDESLDF